jgi:hypothetical protein
VLRWQDLENGGQRLDAVVPGDEKTLLVRGAKLWYVQPRARRFGRVDVPLHWLDRIAQAPELVPEQIAALRQRLGERTSRTAIPLPAERGAIHRIEVAPKAVLRLRVIEVSRRQNYKRRLLPAARARLAFEYDGVAVAPDSRRRRASTMRASACALDC